MSAPDEQPPAELPRGLDAFELGDGVRAVYLVGTDGEPRAGLVEYHTCSDGRERGGRVLFDLPCNEGLPGPRWRVEQWEPLTISPSVLCRCGHHGWIRDGRWEPA